MVTVKVLSFTSYRSYSHTVSIILSLIRFTFLFSKRSSRTANSCLLSSKLSLFNFAVIELKFKFNSLNTISLLLIPFLLKRLSILAFKTGNEKGFVIYSSAPFSKPFRTYSSSFFTVSIITGIPENSLNHFK